MNTKSHKPNRILKSFAAILTLLGILAWPASAADIFKANNGDNLNATTSWTNGVAPTASDVAVWDSTVTGAISNALGANLSWLGVRIASPGGGVTIGAGNTLTIGLNGINIPASATQDLSLSNAVTIGPSYQKWSVGAGRTLNVLALPSKPGTGSATEGAVEFSTTGTIILGNTTAGRITDSQGNPWATYGRNDWAGLNAGTVVAATYTDVTTALTPGVDNNIVGDLPGGTGSAVDVSSIRFNDPTPRTLAIANSGTSRTCTARGVLVTENCGGATIGGSLATSFFRPSRSSTASATSFHFIQNSTIGDLTITAIISNGSSGAPVKVVKSGPGKMIIGGALNGYTGGTVVHAGTLQVNAVGTLSSGAVLVNSGRLAVFSSSTQNVASITINNLATNNVTVTAANSVFQSTTLVLNTGAPRLEIAWNSGITPSTTTAAMYVTNLTLNGTATIDIFSANLAVATYPLIKRDTQTGSGSLALGFLPPRVTAHLSTNVVNNTIDLVVDSLTAPISWATGNGAWNIGTSSNWKDAASTVTTYQELATPYGSFGDAVQFEDSFSGSSPLFVTNNTTVKPASVTVNASKSYTLNGSGSIAGQGVFTKSGSGTLTLATANAFTGALNLNGGTTIFSAITNLGGGTAINFGGGTLQYASGTTDDISTRTVTLGAGGGTINDGGNTITFASPIGNNGAGGLTKTGAGSLTLNGTNRYSGNTLISQGTLVLAANAYISNSPTITVGSGTILDVTASGLTLSAPVGQVLAGLGTVNGNVTLATGTTNTPGTSPGTMTYGNDLTFNGGTLVMDLSTNLAGRDQVIVNGTLTLTSGTLQIAASTALTNGVYKLIQYSVALSGSANNLLVPQTVAGKTLTLSDATAGEIDLMVATLGGANIVWQGDGSANVWNVETTPNWTNSAGSPVTFVNGDNVTFNDTSPNLAVDLATTVLPGSVTVNAAADYTFNTSGSGKISGGARLTKNNSGRLTILTADNNSGTTVINGGVLQVGNNSSTGDIGTGNVTNNAALTFQQTDDRVVSGVLAGAGSLEQAGGATLTLAGIVPYTGPTTITSGRLQVGNGGAAGVMATSTITNNGTLILNSSSSWTYGNGLRGSGALVKSGTGTLSLAGVTAYDGNTFVSNGVLRITSSELIPDGGTSTGWFVLDGAATTAGTFDLNGFNETVNALAGLGSTVNGLITNSGTTGTNILTIGNNNSTDTECFARIADNSSGAKIVVVKKGNSLQTLSGANGYSAGTVVQEGTLRLRNSTAAGTGSIVLSNATTLSLNTAPGNNSIFEGNEIITPSGATVTLTANNVANGYGGLFTGNADSTNSFVSASSISSSATKQFQNFNGTVRVEAGAQVRFSSTSLSVNGGDNTLFEITGSLNTRNGTASGAGVSLGAITGAGTIGGAGNADGNGRYVIGGRGIETTFSGTINGVPPRGTAITKIGAARLTLDGRRYFTNSVTLPDTSVVDYTLFSNAVLYVGTTVVSNGTLKIVAPNNLTNSPNITMAGGTLDVSASGYHTYQTTPDINAVDQPTNTVVVTTSTLDILSSQSLNGYGNITGNVNAQAGSTVNVGTGIGTIAVSGSVVLNGAVNMELNRTNAQTADRLNGTTINVAGATLTVTNVGPDLVTGDVFQLFSGPTTGTLAATNLPVQNASATITYSWTNMLAINGSIKVLSGASPINKTPTNIVASASGNTLDLSWPTDHTGWILQTNSLDVGNTNNWHDSIPDYSTTNHVIINIIPNAPQVFYRLRIISP